MLYFVQQLLNGLHAGALYALLAFGYALTNGVLARTNLAYGPLFAFAGQTAILFTLYAWNVLWLVLPLALAIGIGAGFAYGGFAAAILSRSVLRPLAMRSPNAIVVATLGVAIVLMETGRIAAETRDLWLSPLFSSPVVFLERAGFKVTLTEMQLVGIAVAACAVAAFGRAMGSSRFGREWRAVTDDRFAAALCGVDVARVFTSSVVAGGLVAALAGVMAALHYGNISFGTGLVFGLKVLFVTAVGGYRNPVGAAVGAACFGVAEALWTGYFAIEWRDAWIFALLIAGLVLWRRPGAAEPV